MKLTELFPQFYRVVEITAEDAAKQGISGPGPFIELWPTDDISEADGIRFTDPVWAKDHPGVDGYDFGASVHVGFAGRKTWGMRDTSGKPVAWGFSGTGYSDLTITPSIFVMPHENPPGWHGFVTRGEITTV